MGGFPRWARVKIFVRDGHVCKDCGRDWDDGFTVIMPNQVQLKEPLLPDDSLEVEYQSGTPTGGGADGGCPNAPEVAILSPDTRANQNVPEVVADELEPTVFTDVSSLKVLTDELKPVIIIPEEG